MPKKRHHEAKSHLGRMASHTKDYSEDGPMGHESRSRSEYHRSMMRMKEDSHMIGDDFSAPALCPRSVIDKEWGSNYQYIMDGQIKDLYGAVTSTMKEDSDDLRKELKPTNW